MEGNSRPGERDHDIVIAAVGYGRSTVFPLPTVPGILVLFHSRFMKWADASDCTNIIATDRGIFRPEISPWPLLDLASLHEAEICFAIHRTFRLVDQVDKPNTPACLSSRMAEALPSAVVEALHKQNSPIAIADIQAPPAPSHKTAGESLPLYTV